VAAGGARYLHSVRAFYLDSWKTLRAADNQFWLPYDKGWAPHLIFGREFPTVINHPNTGVRSTWLQPNVLLLLKNFITVLRYLQRNTKKIMAYT
jgi:hypothetical protein